VDDVTSAQEHRERSPGARRTYVVAAAVLLAGAVAAVLIASAADPRDLTPRADVADLPVGPSAPGLNAARGWLNTEPLSAADLDNKVVVYDFWTYSCVNCVRTLPYLRAWHERYAADGLVVVGVHSPEFEFEKDHDNVREAVERLDVTYPVAFDDEMIIWTQFANQYWPAKYISDRKGRLRYAHIGEGSYGETERVIRELLGVARSSPRARVAEGATPGPRDGTTPITPETYLGLLRGTGLARLDGDWSASDEHVTASEPGAAIVLEYRAREVNLVMGSATGAPIDVVVEVDGRPLAPEDRTVHTMVAEDGSTFVRVQASDLYQLVLGRTVGDHTIRLVARGAGLEAFAFTFGA
jgi:thiol-disulfide isomerase/thioredoxin